MAQVRLLPEWAPQQAVLITWPHGHSDWNYDFNHANPSPLNDNGIKLERSFIALTQAITCHQALVIICYDHDHCQALKALLQQKLEASNFAKITFCLQTTDDTWCRDYGPISLQQLHSGETVLANFKFNAWGNKFTSALDNQVNQALHAQGVFGQVPMLDYDFVLEGGSIETDGLGTLLTTKRCLLNPNRNPSFNQTDIELKLRQSLGIERIHWLCAGELEGDDTDAHIDTLARFCDPDTICYLQCTDSNDSHYETLQQMERELALLRNPRGKPYRLVPLPLPKCYSQQDGRRLAASYANFLIINQAVLVPTYQTDFDSEVLQTFRDLFPQRCIIGVDSLAFIEQGGSLHCLTMQLAKKHQ